MEVRTYIYYEEVEGSAILCFTCGVKSVMKGNKVETVLEEGSTGDGNDIRSSYRECKECGTIITDFCIG